MFLQSKSRIIKSFNIVIYFDDDTQKEVTITEGDRLYVEFIEDGNLYAMEGVLKAINTILDDTNETCLTIDGSSIGNCLVKHVRESSIRDIRVDSINNEANMVRVMYGTSGFVSVSLVTENGEDYELYDDEELKLYIRDKETYDLLYELQSPDKTNFVIPAKDLMDIGIGEYVYNIMIENDDYTIMAIPSSKFIIWR